MRIGDIMLPNSGLWYSACSTLSVMLLTMNISALEPSTQPSGERPETLKIKIGDVATRIEAAKMWTLSGLDFRGTVMAVEDSAYGSVITISGVGHLGTAHFLEVPGKPDEVEKECVTHLKFFVDDEEVKEYKPQMDLMGSSFRMERKSTIRALKVESTVDLRDNVLIETARYQADEPIQLDMSYPLMYAWTPAAAKYVFGDDNGIQKRGTFLPADQKPAEGLEKSARWMAVFDPSHGKGALCYVLHKPSDAECWLQYTDAPGIYRKLRLMSFVQKPIPAGFDGAFQSIVGFFEASEEDWEAKAQQRMIQLRNIAAKRVKK